MLKKTAHWSRTTDEAVAERLASTSSALNNQGNPDDYYAQVFTQCLKLADSHAGMRRPDARPPPGARRRHAGGRGRHPHLARPGPLQAALRQPDRLAPGTTPTGRFSSRNSLSIWVALDDATRDNGCLYYLPGTQKTATWQNAGIGRNQADLLKVYPQWREITTVGCPCPAGSAVFHNGLCAHGAGANMTNKPRRAMTCAYMPDGETFNGTRNILPDDYFQTLTVGDVLNDDKINPLIWGSAHETEKITG